MTQSPLSAESVRGEQAPPSAAGLFDASDKMEHRLKELAALASEIERDIQAGRSDPSQTERLLAAWREAVGARTVLELFREVERERNENRMLMDISLKLSSSSGIEDVLRTILDSLQQVVGYAAAGIFVYDRELGQIELDMLRTDADVEEAKLIRKFEEGVRLGQGILGNVVQTAQPIYVPDVRKDSRYIEVRKSTLSELCVPILSQGELIGALNLESDELDAYSERDLRILTIFAAHAGVAIERARADRLKLHTRRIQEEISLARRIQTTFLPSDMPRFDPYELAGINLPSSEVGGDYFDFIPITDSDLGVAIGDVTGHGVGAALLMTNFRACLRIESRNNFAIRTILAKVNDYLYETNLPESFVTAVYGVLDRRNHVFSYANAGHNPPLLLRADGSWETLTVGGILLGAFPGRTYEETSVAMRPGDILVFYTDGVTDAADKHGRQFGLERVKRLVKRSAKLSAREIVQSVCDEVRMFQSSDQPQDDLTFSIVKYA